MSERSIEEEVAIVVLGWKWMTFRCIPVKGTPGYPTEQPIRQFMSPKTQSSERWKEFFAHTNQTPQPAKGNEPLAYCYCSSAGYEWPTFIEGGLVNAVEAAIRTAGLWEQFLAELKHVEWTAMERQRPHVTPKRVIFQAAINVIQQEQRHGSTDETSATGCPAATDPCNLESHQTSPAATQ